MRKQIISMVIAVFLMSGCSMQSGGGNTTSSTSNNTNTTTQNTGQQSQPISSLWGMMDYLGGRGFTYSGISEVTDLNEGYKSGMSFTHNGGNYQLLEFDRDNEAMRDVVDSINQNNKVQLKVNGEYVEMPAYVHENYILIYPEGVEHSEIQGYFR